MNRAARIWTPVAGLLLGPAALVAQEAEGGGSSLFSINLGLSVWTLVVFVVLLWVLKKYAWGPILDAVEAREEGIQQALEEAARRQEEAEKLAEKQRKELAAARREAQEIIAQGREAGEQVRQEIEEKAREEGQRMLERARRQIERERDAALETVRTEAVDLALAAASRLLRKNLDREQDRELVVDYLDGLVEEREETGVEA